MNNDLDRDLESDLDSDVGLDLDRGLAQAAARMYVPPGDVDSVLRRGRGRQRRRRVVAGALTAAAFVATTVTAVSLAGRDAGHTPVATEGQVGRGDVGLAWRKVAPMSGLGMGSAVRQGSVLYSVSTAPGQADVRGDQRHRVVWRSTDGVEWSPASTLGDDLYLSDLTSRDNRVYAVGTAPATSAVGAAVGGKAASDMVVGWSDDGGRSWQRSRLPVDMKAMAARTTFVGPSGMQVAAGPKGTVAVATMSARLNLSSVLPAGTAVPAGWAVTATGVDLLARTTPSCPAGMSPELRGDEGRRLKAGAGASGEETGPVSCFKPDKATTLLSPQQAFGVAGSLTWADLHVDGDLLRAVRRQPVAFVAKAGSTTFERIEMEGVAEAMGAPMLHADDDGFDMVVTSLVGESEARMTVLHSDDGRRWTSLGSPGRGSPVAVGRLGGRVAVVGMSDKSEAGLFRSDGAGGWSSTPLADVVEPQLPPHTTLAVSSADIGPLGLVADVLAIPTNGDGPGSKELGAHRLLVSRDGAAWGEFDVDGLAAEHVRAVGRVLVTADRVLVTATVGRADAPRQVVLVGSPS
ncbi:MAG: hypothetical protein QOK43_1917 [Acidimicrobiaceae bacterium]|nr:hypothetical protein [Acidimicrobiaceae bacterium]